MSTIILIFSGFKVISILKGYADDNAVYDQIDSIIDKNNEPDENQQDISKENLFDYSLQKMNQKAWQALHDENKDFVAYLWFDNDLFKEPIVQTTNNSYYLSRDFNKKYSARGTVFMNCINTIDDMNLTIYGHNSSNREFKFAKLNDLKNDANMYLENAHFSIYFENEIRRYVICYIFVNKDFVNYNHQFTSLTEEEFNTYFNYVKSKNTVPSIQDIEYDDHIMTLQTCLRGDGSFKVMAVAKEIGRYSYK